MRDTNNHPEMKQIYSVLKAFGYKGFGKKSSIHRGWDRCFDIQPTCCDSHRIYTNRDRCTWESTNLSGGKSFTGRGAEALYNHLKTIKYERPKTLDNQPTL